MPIFGEKPFTSITVKINQLAQPHRNDDVDDSIELYLSDLLHLIKLQPNGGAVEAARAVRKKIKYGESVDEQLRALSILELLVLNGGKSIGPVLARDDKLLDVLKGILSGNGKTALNLPYDKQVQQQVRAMAIGWKTELEELEGYKYMAGLYKYIPSKGRRTTRPRTTSSSAAAQSDNLDNEDNDNDRLLDDEDDEEEPHRPNRRSSPDSPPRSPRSPRSPPRSPPARRAISPYSTPVQKTSKEDKDKKKKRRKKNGIVYADEQFQIPQINYKIEAPKIRTLIADCYTHTTALTNALLALPSDISPHDDDKSMDEFNKCRSIRRKVLRYLQYVGAGDDGNKSKEVLAMDEEFLGSLISSNEQLVEVFKKFDFKCGYSIANPAPNYDNNDDDSDDSYESYYTSDSDSEPEEDSIADRLNRTTIEGSSRAAKSPPPPRPAKPAALSKAAPPPKKTLQKQESYDSANPFGDTNEVSKSIYD
ncbi:putative LAS seventeen-binding protein 5 [Scheffersomyces xylosifermentans]|uniref:putative LAS seventeen-binding protein 5 n=1 Tax=Scheffersomyces xylosifermentans TaxID=1304137 RepID=UPI00315C9A2B